MPAPAKRVKPLFIGLYDAKLLGIRYLSAALRAQGYTPSLIFLKSFNSYRVDEPSPEEYELLCKKVCELAPDYVGISIMCSFYLPVVREIVSRLRALTPAKIITGGAYSTLFPEECAAFADIAFRGECEEAIVTFTDALENGLPYHDMENITFRRSDGGFQSNPLRPLIQDLDRVARPDLGGKHMYYINDGVIKHIDPHTQSHSYEMTTSRGCPNRCSYCSNASIFGLYKGKGKYMRQRSVPDVMDEIRYAKTLNPGLRMLRFWDEIFPWKPEWVNAFADVYKKEIGLPFEVWGHPRFSAGPSAAALAGAGLSKIVIGVQSGSPSVRRDVYNRNETQEEILNCSRVLAAAKVPIVVYDFILGHPFETETDLRETLELCRRLTRPFRLNLHGLTFLPGTAIEGVAVAKGVKTWDEIHAEQARPLREQYRGFAWWRAGRGGARDHVKVYWYTLIFLTQFPSGERVIRWALRHEGLKRNARPLLWAHRLYNGALMARVGWHKLKYLVSARFS